ncbi:MAG: YceH family protein [Chitinivibrionales bacterium]|nr:YceH family protein [Chitinivibrionales bacterium]
MDLVLSPQEIRVLGSLIEKELTTPEYYPLTLNSLMLACNQKSNREPVMELSPHEVTVAIEGLRSKHLAWRRSIAGDRVSKFEHNMTILWKLSVSQTALLGVLFLRQAQTVGELKIRTKRMYDFATVDEVIAALKELQQNPEGPFIIELPRQAGQKESRYMHLLAGMPDMASPGTDSAAAASGGSTAEIENDSRASNIGSVAGIPNSGQRIVQLEEKVAVLSDQLALLRQQFEDFKKNFE